MLEIPEAVNIAAQIKESLCGKKVVKAEAAHSPHGFAFYFGDPAGYPALLEGRVIGDAYPNGGQIEIEAEGMRITFNDGVIPRLYGSGSNVPAKHQLYLEFDDGGFIICTLQMYGGMMVFPEGANDNYYYLVAKEKPSPLTGAFDEEYFDSIYKEAKPNVSAKALLATEQRIPGLGNGCLQDILFTAGINPQTKAPKLSDGQRADLYKSMKTVLKAMTDGGGRNTEKDLFGNSGGYRTILSSKTVSEPCPKCGGAIVRKAYMGGNVYFCPACQPVIKT
ncbi:MAG: endonuclease VIII [Clostridiales bacterium]|nr:endonuclease VIII [Clostridiales bacterium]